MKHEFSNVTGLRHRLGMTQRELAELLGVTTITVSRWERGVVVCQGPAAVLLQRLAEDEKKGGEG